MNRASAFALLLSLLLPFAAHAEGNNEPPPAEHPKEEHWSFDGPTGKVDRESAQRGFQVYKEVCSSCHSLKRIPFRGLTELGFSDAEVKALASTYQIEDGPNDKGDMFKRPGKPSDYFLPPFPNENAARASNGGALPPDLRLIVKARHDGANYVFSILTGFRDAPAGFKLNDGMHYNLYFPGRQIAMPPPLSPGQVKYADATEASVEQMARDVVNFLQWAAEPEMEHRKRMGLKAMAFLFIMSILFYFAMKRIWKDVH